MCQCTLFDGRGVEIHSIECIEYCTKDQSNALIYTVFELSIKLI